MPGRIHRTVGSVKPGGHMHAPVNERDWRAWYLRDKETGDCPLHTHPAPGYDHIHSHKRWCVRDCNKWKGAKRTETKTGKCMKKTAWLEILADARQVHAPQIQALQGLPKREFLKNLMTHTATVYTQHVGKGSTLGHYYAVRDRVLRLL